MGYKPGRTWGGVPSFDTDSRHLEKKKKGKKRKKLFKLFGLCFDAKLERNAIPPPRSVWQAWTEGRTRTKRKDQWTDGSAENDGIKTDGRLETRKENWHSTERVEYNGWVSL
ncbi:hypothetical protein ElyMa_006375600 [Elysia marginata]|uniref:G-patch domain-containing protein n=1 Tax=Elysia marginata TaxID=1093978 RepID=A0AAV4HQN8_9GAST|nr:hypothetical protein ElyMa_006375600 [Elysia marginata]